MAASTTLERQVADEQEEHDAAQVEPEEGLFTAADYDREDLALPRVDGHGMDRIHIAFTGGVWLDRADPNDVALYRQLMLGKDVELRVEGKVTQKGAKGATNKDGNLDVVSAVASVTVHTVMRPVLEQAA